MFVDRVCSAGSRLIKRSRIFEKAAYNEFDGIIAQERRRRYGGYSDQFLSLNFPEKSCEDFEGEVYGRISMPPTKTMIG